LQFSLQAVCPETFGYTLVTKNLKEKLWEVVDWIHLAQDREKWWVLGDNEMNFWVP
jgi:hypothetical protein